MDRALKGIFVAVIIVGAVGCASSKLKKDNEALKTQVLDYSAKVTDAESEIANLRAENAALQSQLGETQADATAKTDELARMTANLKGQGFDAQMRGDMMVVTMDQKILFASGSASLSKTGSAKLSQLARMLNGDLAGYPVEVQGHTDNDPIIKTKNKYKSNWELSYERAQTVTYQLIKAGISPKRLHASAYGEQHPVKPNSSSSGKAANRRVEIVVMRPGASAQ